MVNDIFVSVNNNVQYNILRLILNYYGTQQQDRITLTEQTSPDVDARLTHTGHIELTGFTTICKYIIKSLDDELSNSSNKINSLLGDNEITNTKVSEWLIFIKNELNPLMDVKLHKVNEYLSDSVFASGNKLTLVDIVLYVTVHSAVRDFPIAQLNHFSHLLRWYDLIQHTVDKDSLIEKVNVKKASFNFKKNYEQIELKENKKEDKSNSNELGKKEKKAKTNETSTTEVGIDMLDMRIGKIIDIKKHPDADSLYVEQIDLGEDKPRQVISGLVKFVSIEEMKNRNVVVICNLKKANMRGIESNGMVLCASDEKHEKCEPLNVPKDSKPGDKVYCKGCKTCEKPLEEIKPKQKILDRLFPDLVTDKDGHAKYKEFLIETEKGPLLPSSIKHGLVR